MGFIRTLLFAVTVGLTLVLGAKVFAQPDDTSLIVKISNLRMQALHSGDKVTFDRYTSDRYQSIYDDGAIQTKQSSAASYSPFYSDTAVWSGKPHVRFIGDTALVTGTEIETEKFPGGTVVSTFTRTELYAKENGEWKAETAQVTVQPRNYTKAVDAPKNLAQFAGRYQWAPGLFETVRTSNGRLISSLNGGNSALLFVGPDATTESDDLGVGTFYRNGSGQVAGYVYRRCDGQTVKIPKV